MPLFGKLLSKVAISRVTRTLSTLLSGGVSMLESLKITSTTPGNVIIEKSVMDARRQVTEGRSLTESFKATGRFPFDDDPDGQRRRGDGDARPDAEQAGRFLRRRGRRPVAALLSILEPVMMIFVGGIVGGLVLSMYLPIFSLMAQF